MPENDKLKFSQLDEITRAQMAGSDYAVGYKANGDNKKWTFENQADFLLNDSDAGQEFQETFVKVQDTEPSDENNRIWVKETPDEEVVVPTYDEFEAVADDVEDLKSALSDVISNGVGDFSENLMPFMGGSITVNNVNAQYVNGKLILVGTANDSGGRNKKIIEIPLQAGTYRFQISETQAKLFITDASNNILAEKDTAGGTLFTLSADLTVYLSFNTVQNVQYNSTVEIMLSAGSTVNDFAPPVNSAKDDIARQQIQELIDDLDNPVVNITPTVTDGSGYFINTSGLRFSLSGYYYTDVITITKGQKIKFRANGETPNVISMLSRWGADGEFIENLHTCTSSQYEVVEHTATNPVEFLRLCYSSNSSGPYLDYCQIIGNANLDSVIPIYDVYDAFPFNSVGIIGDSLASGASNYENSQGVITGVDRPEYSWGKYLHRRHGIDVEMFTKGGASTRSWLDPNNSWGVTAMQAAEKQDLYIIGLGANDYYSLGPSYLGTTSDIVTDASATQNDTYYGNFSKIICLIKQKSPRSKIFCLTNPDMPSMTPPNVCKNYNTAVRNIVNAFNENVYLIDLETDMYFISSQAKGLWYWGHSTAIGYANIAEHFWDIFNKFVRENYTEFLDVQWIQQDHD